MYSIDTGMANALAFGFSENIGNLMENVVAMELLRRISKSSSRLEMYYWKDPQHREVDIRRYTPQLCCGWDKLW